jgi:hypothetical protein
MAVRATPQGAGQKLRSFSSAFVSFPEQKQSNSALGETLKRGFFLRKEPLEVRAFGYIYSGSAVAQPFTIRPTGLNSTIQNAGFLAKIGEKPRKNVQF